MKGHEKPILLIFEKLLADSDEYTANNKHYLNKLIGAK
jgi:hypothetical protein